MKRVILILSTLLISTSSYALSGTQCYSSIKSAVNGAMRDLNSVNRANRTAPGWNEARFKDCMNWLNNRSAYQNTCEDSNTKEWKAIRAYFEQNSLRTIDQACGQPGCRCPGRMGAGSSIKRGGIPNLLQEIKILNQPQSMPPNPLQTFPELDVAV